MVQWQKEVLNDGVATRLLASAFLLAALVFNEYYFFTCLSHPSTFPVTERNLELLRLSGYFDGFLALILLVLFAYAVLFPKAEVFCSKKMCFKATCILFYLNLGESRRMEEIPLLINKLTAAAANFALLFASCWFFYLCICQSMPRKIQPDQMQ